MRAYNLKVLGHQISFKSETAPHRVEKAQLLLEDRFKQLKEQSGSLAQEKILVFLALALADDMLEAQEKLELVEKRLELFLQKLSETDQAAN